MEVTELYDILDGIKSAADSNKKDLGAAGNAVVDEIVVTPQQQSLSPASLQRTFHQTGFIQALLRLICKYQYEDEDSQNKLYELINAHFANEKSLTSRSGDINVKLNNSLLQYFEKAIETAKKAIECKNSTLLLYPRIILSNALGNNSVIYLFEKPKYTEIFSNIEKIGKGGGGKVYKGKHNVDECYDALKIIPLQDKHEEVLKEAKYLANLQHPNIIVYKTAWLDYCADQDCLGSSESSAMSSTNELYSNNDDNSDNSVVFEEPRSSNISSVLSKCSRWKNEVLKESPRKLRRSVSCEEPKLADLNMKSAIVKYKTKYSIVNDQGSGANYNFVPTTNEMLQPVLIIQMELCSCTLRDFLDKRIESAPPKIIDVFDLVDETKMLDILKCILIAVEYCHNSDYIHRDLKPSNIFFDKNGVVKIGDFGLATTKMLNENPKSTECCNLKHTSNIGTRPYAAPEQLAGSKYNYKVDMHSLGIIIIELFYPFLTGMEKSKIFDEFKSGQVPQAFKEKWPKQASLILKLLSDDPSKRPDAKDILISDLFHQNESDTQLSQQIIPDIIITPADQVIDNMDFETLKLYAKQLETENTFFRKKLKDHNLF